MFYSYALIEQETSKAGLDIQLGKLMIEQDQVYAIPNVTISFSIIRSTISMICFVMWSIWFIKLDTELNQLNIRIEK